MTADEPTTVGRVLGTQHTSTSEFRVVLDETSYLQLDDLVVVRTEVPPSARSPPTGWSPSRGGLRRSHLRIRYPPHRRARASSRRSKVRSAQVAITRVDPELWVSPDPGEVVRPGDRAESDDKALYTDEMGRPLPIGLGRDGEPMFVDLDFFDGRKGGHMSISGISGRGHQDDLRAVLPAHAHRPSPTWSARGPPTCGCSSST